MKRTLKPDGVFAMYNFYRQGWVVGRLAKMAEEVFGEKPLVISLPQRDAIGPGDNQFGHITFLLVSSDSKRLQAIRERFAKGESFWLNPKPPMNEAINAFRTAAPASEDWFRSSPARLDVTGIDRLPSDDWPQLYLRERAIPWAPIGQGMLVIALLSLAILLAFAPRGRVRPNWQMFFLGAGFMLLETKGVVHMALLFGGTWIVNSIVFFAILVMILCANLFVLKVKPQKLLPYYVLLVAALLVNALVPMHVFLSLAPVGARRHFLPGGVRAGVLRRRNLRHRVPRQPATRRRFRLERGGHHPRRPERAAVAGARLQPAAAGGGGILRVVARVAAAQRVTADKAESLPLPVRFAAFALVGGLCLAVNTVVLWWLTSGLGIHYLASTVIAFVSITPLGFFLNKAVTFRTRREYARIELPRYFSAMAASFALNLLLMYLLVSVLGVWYLTASLLVAAVVLIVNFLSSDRWSFRVQR